MCPQGHIVARHCAATCWHVRYDTRVLGCLDGYLEALYILSLREFVPGCGKSFPACMEITGNCAVALRVR